MKLKEIDKRLIGKSCIIHETTENGHNLDIYVTDITDAGFDHQDNGYYINCKYISIETVKNKFSIQEWHDIMHDHDLFYHYKNIEKSDFIFLSKEEVIQKLNEVITAWLM